MLDIFTHQTVRQEKLTPLKKNALGSRKKSTSASLSSLSFKDSLLVGVSQEFDERIDQFVGQLDDLQQELLKQPSLELVEKYRFQVGAFLKELFSHYQSHSFFRGKLGQRIEIKIWHSVNQEFDSLSRAVLEENKEGLNLLKHLGLLKGIILDLKIGKS